MRDPASKKQGGAEEMAQQFRAIAALTDDLGLIAITHKVAQNYPDSSSRKS